MGEKKKKIPFQTLISHEVRLALHQTIFYAIIYDFAKTRNLCQDYR